MANVSELEPWLRVYADALLRLAPGARVTSVYRSYTSQLDLWNRRATNPFPVAPPGRSYHQYRRAFDVVADELTLRWLGAVWNAWGGTWSERDVIHFQA